MGAPRHLWSGDWRLESAAAAKRLAERQAGADASAATVPEPPSEPPATARHRAAEWLRAAGRRLRRRSAALRGVRRPRPARRHRSRPPLRAIVIGALVAMIAAAAAFAAVTLFTGPSGSAASRNATAPRSATASGSKAPAWLGVQLQVMPFGGGAMVVDVVPGSPADAAGIQPGDVITQIGSRAVAGPGDVTSALAGLHAGEQIVIQVQQGPLTYTARATLAARPPGYP